MSKLRQQFNDYFEEETGWEPSEHPDKQYVADLWDAFQAGHCAESDEEDKPPVVVEATDQYPTYGYTQKELRYFAVDCDLRVFEAPDGTIYCIHHNGEVDPHRRDLSGWWLEKLEDYL